MPRIANANRQCATWGKRGVAPWRKRPAPYDAGLTMYVLGCLTLLSAFGALLENGESTHLPPLVLEAPTLRLDCVVESGEPLAAALSPDGQRVFAIEGTQLVELEEGTDGWVVVDSVRVDGEAAGLHVTDRRIFLAGGSAGCVMVEYAAGLGAPVVIATEDGKLCVDVASDGSSIAVLFRDYARTSVHVLAASDLARAQRVRLAAGAAEAIEILGSELYLAEGEHGVRHIPLRAERPGSASKLAPWPSGSHARDLARSGHTLWVAAGGSGLVSMDLEQAWGAEGAKRVHGLGPALEDCHALRVAASGQHLALGISPRSAALADALPGGLLGAPGHPLTWNPGSPGTPTSLQIWKLDEAGHPQFASQPDLPPGAWRSLAVAGGRVLVQRSHDGLRAAYLGQRSPSPTEFGSARRGSGISPLDGQALPNAALLFGVDGRGSTQAAGLRLRTRGADPWRAPFENEVGLGSLAYWRSTDARATPGGEEGAWVAIGGAQGLTLHSMLDGKGVLARLPPRMEPSNPAAPVRVHAFGEYVAVCRPSSSNSLYVYRQQALESFASGRLSTTPNPVMFLRKVAEGASSPTSVWACDSLPMGRGRWLLVCAAGSGSTADDPELSRPLMLTFLVEGSGLRPLSSTLGSDGPGMATSVAVFEERGRRWALLASLGGQLELFDLSNPGSPQSVVHQPMAPSPWDAVPPALIDVEVVQLAGRATQALVAAGRAGLMRFDLGDLQTTPPHPDLIPDEVFDTPGWAAGVAASTSPGGGHRVVVGDQRGGARIYRWIFESPERGRRD